MIGSQISFPESGRETSTGRKVSDEKCLRVLVTFPEENGKFLRQNVEA